MTDRDKDADLPKGEELHITPKEDVQQGSFAQQGLRGGMAPAMAPTMAIPAFDRIRWSAVWSGLLLAISVQILLTAFGLGVGLYGITSLATAGGVNWTAVGIWNAIWALIALFIGGFVAARLAGSTTTANGIWHGVVVWALTLTLGGVISALGLLPTMAFGGVRALAFPAQAGGFSTAPLWGFIIGSLLGLGAAILGGALGKRRNVDQAP